MEGFLNKNYVVDKVLRKRPLGNVFKARRVSDGVLCAIKELDVRHMSEEEKDDAMEEIRVLATVRNENVISYYDAFASENKLYVVMEYCDDPDLGRHIKTRAENQKFFSEAQVWSYLIQMLRGLVAVHSRGLIHRYRFYSFAVDVHNLASVLERDVRSGNIIQLDSSAIKIGDIRVGKVLKEGLSATTDFGNPHIVPPEVWQNKAYTFKSDVWAVGCVLYEMITLAVPFGGCSLPDLKAKVIEGQYHPISTSFSSGLSSVLKLLLNPNQATRVSARDMLLHPILQAHLHHAPAPAPKLRVRASQEKSTLGSIPALSSSFAGLKSSYPILVVPGDKEQVGKALDGKKDVAEPPENSRHKSGLSSERPTAPAVRSRVAPVLAPRAVLSSRDNDEMLADANRPSNQASKVKVPRVAMLSKAIPKSPPTETSVSPAPQSLPSTPRVNMRHFKTAYIQSPKVLDPDEFPTASFPDDRSDVSRKEKFETLVNINGPPKSKLFATPPTPKFVALRREKSTESVRSAGSSRSDDSSIRVRAPIDTLDPSRTESATPRKESSVESALSMGSSHSGESVMRVRAPVDVSDAPQAGVVTSRGDSFRSVTSGASSHSNGSGVSVRATLTDLDPAQPAPSADDLQTSLAGDGMEIHQAPPESSATQIDTGDGMETHQTPPEPSATPIDNPEPSQGPDVLGGNEPLQPNSSSTHISKAPTGTKPVNSQTKATTAPNRNVLRAPDGAARKTSGTSGSAANGLGDGSERSLPTPRNRRLSFDGTRNEKPAWASDHTKLAALGRESSFGTRKPATGNGVATKGSDSVASSRAQGGGASDPSRIITRPSTGSQRPPSDGSKRGSQNGDVLPRRPLTARGKDDKGATGNSSANPSKLVSPVAQTGRKSAANLPAAVPPINPANRQGPAGRVSGTSTTTRGAAAVPAQIPQRPLRSRRLSLDFPMKGKEIQPMGRGLGHVTGTAS